MISATDGSDAALMPQHGGPWLARGGVLRHQSLTSASGRCTLVHELDGLVVLYDNALSGPLWGIATPQSVYLGLGLDGDLVAWDRYRRPMWASGTAQSGVERLEVRDAGEAVLLDGADTVVWTIGRRVTTAASCREPARGSLMRRGQTLQRQTLTSEDGSTVLFHRRTSVQLRDPNGRTAWSVAFSPAHTCLMLDDDGMLVVRDAKGSVVKEIAGPGAELVVVRGGAQLRADDGTVVWTTARDGGTETAPLSRVPSQHQLASWIDSIAGERGYCATVVLNLEPAEALRRLGLPDAEVARATWAQLQAWRGQRATAPADVIVSAVALGPHTFVLADDRWAGPPAPALSAGTMAVTSCHSAGTDDPGISANDFLVQRDGVVVAQLGLTPPRRKGARLPELRQAFIDMDSRHTVTTAELYDLELMCRVAGASPTAEDLTGELLGGILGPQPTIHRSQ
jgi:hypothetical protein